MFKIEKSAARRILARSPNWLGDAIMCLPAIKALSELFEPERFTVVAADSLQGLFERYKFINDVKYVSKGASSTAHKELKNKGYDAIFLFTNSFRSALDAYGTRCPIRVGYAGNFRGAFLTHKVPKLIKVHMVDYYLNLVRPFGNGLWPPTPEFPLLPEEADYGNGIDGLKGAVAIPLGANYGKAKCWPHANIKKLVKLIASAGERRVVVLGTDSDRLQADALESAAPNTVINLAGKTTIGQLAAVLSRCEWVVANDSGPLHIAGAVGAKTLAVFGPTDHSRTAPMAECVKIITQEADCSPCLRRECNRDHRCMKNITAEEIYGYIAGLDPELYPPIPTEDRENNAR